MPTWRIHLPDPTRARGSDPDLAFRSTGAEGFAGELQAALAGDGLFRRWRAKQFEPDEVDPALGAVDPQATVTGTQREKRAELEVRTSLSGDVLRHRLRLLAGSHWELRDVH